VIVQHQVFFTLLAIVEFLVFKKLFIIGFM